MPALAGRLDPFRKLCPCLACLTLGLMAGCGGGGNGAGETTIATSPSLARGDGVGLPVLDHASQFNTIEYERSGALGSVNAAELYSVGGTGAGRIVAVIDTGVDRDHPDLAPRIHKASTDILNRDEDYGWDHGTHVAGLIAGSRNDQGMHGLAFDAEILSIRADRLDSCPDACSYDEYDLARATDYAVANGADVINFSLGSSKALADDYTRSLVDAAAAGRILVFSAGNGSDSDPNYPGLFALSSDAKGRAIIVGSIDSDDRLSDFSNRAGSARDVFLVAPGEDLITTDIGGGSALVSGTSFAAPTVAAAAAALLDAAPFLSAEEVVEILLITAQDLGDEGVDEIYGWGKLDLAAAAAPQGTLILPMGDKVETGGQSLTSSKLQFNGPLAGSKPQGQLMAAALDDYGRAFQVRLDAALSSVHSQIDLEPFLASRNLDQQTLEIGPNNLQLTTFTQSGKPRHISLAGELTPSLQLDVFAAQDDEAASTDALLISSIDRFALLGERAGFALQGDLAQNAFWHADTTFAHDRQSGLGNLSRIGLGHDDGTQKIDLTLAHHIQDRGDDTAQGAGLFEQQGEQRSAILGFTIEQKLAPHTSIRLHNAIAHMQARENAALKIDDFFAHHWSLALSHQGWIAGDDQLTLALSQPLRAINPGITTNLPVSRGIDGSIQRQKRHHQLGGQGREIDLELAYRQATSKRTDTGLNLVYRHEPGHQADQSSEILATFTFRLRF